MCVCVCVCVCVCMLRIPPTLHAAYMLACVCLLLLPVLTGCCCSRASLICLPPPVCWLLTQHTTQVPFAASHSAHAHTHTYTRIHTNTHTHTHTHRLLADSFSRRLPGGGRRLEGEAEAEAAVGLGEAEAEAGGDPTAALTWALSGGGRGGSGGTISGLSRHLAKQAAQVGGWMEGSRPWRTEFLNDKGGGQGGRQEAEGGGVVNTSPN